MSDTEEAEPVRSGRARVRRVAFRLVMAALILLLAGRTYQETAVALARPDGLRTTAASVTELTSHTVSGRSGGGQDGGDGSSFTHTEYTVRLDLGDGRKTADDVEDQVGHDLWEGKRVTVGLWHGRVVEIDGRDVWPGWHFGALDVTLIVLTPLITAYLISLAVSAAALLAAGTGRVRAGRDDRFGPCALGTAVAVAALLGLLVHAAFGHVLPYWPAVPVCAGTAVALLRLTAVVRRLGRTAAESTPAGTEDAPTRA
ncbi:hypothetical protein J2X68_002501 [Streptomyces sp. 3330]|uniref:hypothetical protein n=1 Tax=Streptomyces sp. 3330 TaxID=2817755 RepID=UPI002862571A|nr:hypothetical protein [Streptomyces sp. 3330]MDR6975813.1 hypothetical protein [Streptomyces sp. 3330]